MFRRLLISLLLLVLGVFAGTPAYAQSNSDTVLVIRPELTRQAPRFPGFAPRLSVKRPRVALVLSGGGARGAAAIGVIQAIERHRIPIDLIVGTSIGSIVGGLYASGYSTEELKSLIDTTNWDEIMSLDDDARRRDMFIDQKLARDKSVLVLRFNGLEPIIPESFSTGQRLTNFLNILALQGIYHPDPSFDDLRIPFRAVSTDLVSGRRIVIDRGDLAEALRASMAIPLLFSSVRRDSLQLLDGGLVSNLPVDVARETGCEIVIAVDMTSPLRPRSMLNAPWEIADQITTIMMQEAKQIARSRSDVVIVPKIGDHSSSDFTHLDSLILEGEIAGEKAIPYIRDLIEKRTMSIYARPDSRTFRRLRWRTIGADATPPPAAVLQAKEEVTETQLRLLAADLSSTGNFSDISITVLEADDSTDIELRVKSYPRVRKIEIQGAERISPDSIASLLQPITRQPLNVRFAEQLLDSMQRLYRERGFALARVREVRYDSVQGVGTVVIDEGIISRSVIQGTQKTRDWIIWRELPWRDGDVFDVHQVARGISNLYGTNLFEQVLVSVRHEGEHREQNVVVIQVRERSTELIRLGLRADNERNIQPSIDVRDENFLGAGSEVGLIVGFGPRNQSVTAEAKATRIFNSYFTFGLKGHVTVHDINVYADAPTTDPKRFERERVGEFRERRYGGTFSFGTQLERLGSVTVEARLENHRVSNVYATPIDEQEYSISSLRFGTNIDTQDKFPFPTDGMSINFYYESALVKFIEAVGFTKLFFSYERYHTITQRHTLRPKIVLGVGDETLPISEQFSLGGQHSFFGYAEDNARGRQMFVGSLEYQYRLPLKLFFDTYFKARYDIGSTWLKPDELRLEDLEHGVGVSLAFDTPVGPAEFSLGRSFYLRKDLLERPVTWGPVEFYFSIGYPLGSGGR